MFPPQLLEIVGKTFGFGISVDAIEKFNAMRVWNLNDILMKRIKALHQMSSYARKKRFTSEMKIEVNDHGEFKEKNIVPEDRMHCFLFWCFSF